MTKNGKASLALLLARWRYLWAFKARGEGGKATMAQLAAQIAQTKDVVSVDKVCACGHIDCQFGKNLPHCGVPYCMCLSFLPLLLWEERFEKRGV